MKKLTLVDMKEAMRVMAENLSDFDFGSEWIDVREALGRKITETFYAAFDVPGFKRSAVDGYAVRLEDFTEGHGTLKLCGRVQMGKPYCGAMEKGCCIFVPTGGMVPEGTEAMVMQEYTRFLEDDLVQFQLTPKVGDHVVRADEDFSKGTSLVEAGTFLKAAHLGKLSAAGYRQVRVYLRPKVVILSTGNELMQDFKAGEKPEAGKVYDINGITLASLAEGLGFEVVAHDWCSDDEASLHRAMEHALEGADMVILSGGSSVGEKDVTSGAVARFPSSKLLLHGIRIKPGKPTLMAKVHLGNEKSGRNKLILGLPGHPASAFMIMSAFGTYLAEQVWQIKAPDPWIRATLGEDLRAAEDRDQLVLVSLSSEAQNLSTHAGGFQVGKELIATPSFGKSAAISHIAASDGYMVQLVEMGALTKGDEVWVKKLI